MLDWIFGSKKEEEKKGEVPALPEEDMWVYDFIKQYLISPIWKNPLLDYIEENCLVFEDNEENKFEYTKIFQGFVSLCSVLLESIIKETGITQTTLQTCIILGLKNKNDRKIFQQVILCDNFLSFKKIMIAKNKQLEIAAMKAANEKKGIQNPIKEQLDAKELERLEIQKAIALSLALEEKMSKKEEKLFEEAIRQSQKQELKKQESPKKNPGELPPLVIGSNRQPKTIEAFKVDEQNLNKEIKALKIQQEKQKKEQEGAEERKKRLQEQRELIMKKKTQERKIELNAFVQNKPEEKKEEGSKVSEEELERRKNLMKKLKQQLKD